MAFTDSALALPPEVITTSLGHISHVLMLASHYLAVRLPAEITLPHREYPYATIFSLPSSYKPRGVSFRRSAPQFLSADPGSKRLPRARPLYIHKPLPQLLKDDPSTYSFFLEGVTLLAYNIAWLSFSQGTLISETNSFEDICQMGRNLYNLLIEPQKSLTSKRDNEPSWSGRFSHGTMYYNLSGAEGSELIRAFRLPSPRGIADKLKRELVGDAPAPDWELLEDEAWKVEDNVVSEDWKSTASKSTSASQNELSKGSSGWTKVR